MAYVTTQLTDIRSYSVCYNPRKRSLDMPQATIVAMVLSTDGKRLVLFPYSVRCTDPDVLAEIADNTDISANLRRAAVENPHLINHELLEHLE